MYFYLHSLCSIHFFSVFYSLMRQLALRFNKVDNQTSASAISIITLGVYSNKYLIDLQLLCWDFGRRIKMHNLKWNHLGKLRGYYNARGSVLGNYLLVLWSNDSATCTRDCRTTKRHFFAIPRCTVSRYGVDSAIFFKSGHGEDGLDVRTKSFL